MDQEKKKRGENWTSEEKAILRHLVYQYAHILEDKSTKTNINMLKSKTWKNVTNKLNEIEGKTRTDAEIKLAWKRMKLTAKANLSLHRREQSQKGGGQKPKKRGDNWTSEEKEMLRHLVSHSAHILEDKSTKMNTNMLKSKEWKNVTNKLNKILGKTRTDAETKLAWKRMKLTAKANLSLHRREQSQTGGGQKPPSPSPEDLQIMSIAPYDFAINVNNYDSDAVITIPPETVDSPMADSSLKYDQPILSGDNAINTTNKDIKAIIDMPKNTEQKSKKVFHNRSEQGCQAIINSNIDFKKKQLEMLEMEHKYNIKISELKIKKLVLQIELLENQSITKEPEKNNS